MSTKPKRLLVVSIVLALLNVLYLIPQESESTPTETIIYDPIPTPPEPVEVSVRKQDPTPYPEMDPFFWVEPETVKLTEEDEEVLLKISKAEAGNQGVEGKALVMQVVINRMKNSSFPDTAKEVVFQHGQFSPVASGFYAVSNPDEECYEALSWVKHGEYEYMKALYFNNSPMDREFLFQHRDHYFYK